jgi:hypothetical protein
LHHLPIPARMFPLLRLPVPANPTPAETSYDDVRGMIKAFIADLAAAEKTLAAIRDENVALPRVFRGNCAAVGDLRAEAIAWHARRLGRARPSS